MKTGKIGFIPPAQSMMLMLLCGAGVLVFLLWLILPAQQLSAQLDRDIENLQTRIEEQKILAPVFKTLFAKTKTTEPQALPAPTRTKLTRDEITGVPKRLQQLAAAHRLKVREIVPEVGTLTDASGRFLIRLAASGQFMDLRGFLIDVGALPYFDSIEEIEIRAVEEAREFGLKIWMSRE
jgi:Tfp pilus assembly protein PilO